MTDNVATATLTEAGFIELTFLRENITLDVNEVMEGWSKARQLSPYKKAMVLLKTGKWTLLEKDAREYVMNELKSWPAVAVVVDNLGQRIMGQMVINMTGKGSHIQLFNNEIKSESVVESKVIKK